MIGGQHLLSGFTAGGTAAPTYNIEAKNFSIKVNNQKIHACNTGFENGMMSNIAATSDFNPGNTNSNNMHVAFKSSSNNSPKK